MFPTVIRKEPVKKPCDPSKNAPGGPSASSNSSAGTNTVEVGTKFDSGFSRYHMHTGCLKLTLRSGAKLDMRFNQFPGQGLNYAGVGPDSWSPAGRGGVFSFLPFIQQEYPLGIQTDRGTVDFNISQGSIGTVTYYAPSTALAMRGRNDTVSNLFTVDDESSGERWVFANKSSAGVPGRLLRYYDRNGNELTYTYRPRPGGAGKYNILHKITGDLPQGLGVYFSYGDATNEAAYAHVHRFVVGNGTAGQDRAVYFQWDATRHTLQRVAYPGGCTTSYDFVEAGSYVQAAIRKEVDQENYSTYFEYISANTTLRKSVEPLGRVTYYSYDTAAANRIRAGRPATQFRSEVIGGGLQATRREVRPDGTAIYYDYDLVTSRMKRKVSPGGRQTYYRYNARYALASEKEVTTGAEKAYAYGNDAQSLRAEVGPRHTVGFPVVTYFEYDAKFNVTMVRNPVLATKRRRFDAQGRLLAEVDPRGGTTYHRYDPQVGQVSATVDARGNSSYFRYNAFAELLSSISPRWKEAGGMAAFTTSYACDQRGRVVKRRNPLGQTAYFGYTARGDLASIQDPRQVVRVMRYDALRRRAKESVLGATGGALSATYFAYDAFDNLTKATDGRGFATTMTYDVMDRRTTVTDALSGVKYYGYDQAGNRVIARDALGRATRLTYDPLGRLVAFENAAGGRSYFAYDLANNLALRRDERGNKRTGTHDAANRTATETDALNGKTYFGYDSANNLTRRGDELGRRNRYEYDASNRLTVMTNRANQASYFGYDAAGNVVKERNPRGYANTLAYDAADRPVRTTDALGGIAYFGYDAVGNVIKTRDALQRTALAIYDGMNRVVAITDANGGKTYFAYDKTGNPTIARDQRGANNLQTFDAIGRRDHLTDALGNQTYFGYDAVGNLAVTEDARSSITQRQYDAVNRLVAQVDALGGRSYFGYDAAGNPIKVRDARGNAAVTTFDALNRRTTVVDPLGGKNYFGYDAVGNRVKQRNALNATTLTSFDAMNRVVASTNPLAARTYYAYDAAGNRTTVIDPLLRATVTTYDALDRPTAVTDPTTAVIRMAYDAVGNVRKEVNGLGRATYFAYDALNRLSQQVDPLNVRSYFTYDAASNLTGHHVKSAGAAQMLVKHDLLGRKHWFQDGLTAAGTYFGYDAVGNLTSIADQTGVTTREYDEMNRLATSVSPRGDATYFGYSATSQRTKVQYPRGTARTVLVRDQLDRIRKLRSPSNRDVYYVYDAASRPVKMKLGAGSACYYAFDAAHRPTQIRHAGSAGATIAQFQYRRDLAGRINRIIREGDLAIYYQYDGADRLKSEVWARPSVGVQVYGFQYQYDNGGNRTSAVRTGLAGAAIDSTAYVYNAANALTKRWVTPANLATYYVYDASGSTRLIVEGGTATYFEYGRHGLVTRIIPPAAKGQPWAFGYDGRLNRTRMVRGDTGKSTYFTWDGLDLLEERDATGTLIARYIHGRPVAPGIGSVVEVQRPSVPLGSQFLHADHRGTVHRVTDAYGRIQIAYTLDAFGRPIVPTAGLMPAMANDIAVQGNWLTITVGGKRLGLSPSRVYDPETGLFLQKDPFPAALKAAQAGSGSGMGIYQASIFEDVFWRYRSADLGGINLFTFASGNPVNRVDPTGLPDDYYDTPPDFFDTLWGVATGIGDVGVDLAKHLAGIVVAGGYAGHNVSVGLFTGNQYHLEDIPSWAQSGLTQSQICRIQDGQWGISGAAKDAGLAVVASNPLTGSAMAGWNMGTAINQNDPNGFGQGLAQFGLLAAGTPGKGNSLSLARLNWEKTGSPMGHFSYQVTTARGTIITEGGPGIRTQMAPPPRGGIFIPVLIFKENIPSAFGYGYRNTNCLTAGCDALLNRGLMIRPGFPWEAPAASGAGVNGAACDPCKGK